nr:DUF2851 family protein [Calditrichia bacterium]
QHDSRYERVMLHLVWENSQPPAPLAGRFPQVCLSGYLRIPETQWRQRMMRLEGEMGRGRLPAYPAPPVDRLAELALARFHRRVSRIKAWSAGRSPDHLTFLLVAEAMGFHGNQAPFRHLFWEEIPLPPTGGKGPLPRWLWWVYLGGLKRYIPATAAPAWSLFHTWQTAGYFEKMQPAQWQVGGIHPHNHPLFRLAALSQLHMGHAPAGLLSRLLALAGERRGVHRLLKDLPGCLWSVPDPELNRFIAQYWRQSLPCQGVGRQRLGQICLNALLPLFYWWAVCSGNEGFREYVLGMYEGFPKTELIPGPPGISKLLRGEYAGGFWEQGFLEWASQVGK